MKKVKLISKILEEKILALDGPMGTMIQKEGLTEQDFKGEKFKKIKNNLKGNNDLLNITCEKLIYNIHKEYLDYLWREFFHKQLFVLCI